VGLALTRRVGQKIMIDGGRVEIIVAEIKGSYVRLLIEAPPEVSIHRAEVQERIDSEEAGRGRTGAT
jgi:carbon storage regulator